MGVRYEILPFGAALEETAAARGLTVTVTCSPRHGINRTLEVAAALAAQGHEPVPHIAARMLRDADHLDAVLERSAESGVRDLFVIGGDAREACGPYSSAVDLLAVLDAHRLRPERLGIAAYPEGHPFIDRVALDDALARKAAHADYAVTQLCFDPRTLIDWLRQARRDGFALPVYAGIPGAVDRRKLLEVSVRVGVGASVGFLRRQHGIRRLLSRPEHAADRLFDALAPRVGEDGLGLEGLHLYTFDRVRATLAWQAGRRHRMVAEAHVKRHG